MTPEAFAAALESLHWKQSDFCRKTGVNKSTPSNWMTRKTPIPPWVAAYLDLLLDLKRLHAAYLVPPKADSGDTVDDGE